MIIHGSRQPTNRQKAGNMIKQIQTERGIITVDFVKTIPTDARYSFSIFMPERHDIYSISIDMYHHDFYALA